MKTSVVCTAQGRRSLGEEKKEDPEKDLWNFLNNVTFYCM